MNKKSIGIFATTISAVYFGFTPFITTQAYQAGGTALTVSALRFILSLPVVFLYLKIIRADFRITKKQFLDILILTVFGQAGTTALLFSAYNFLNTGTATTIHFMYPTCTILGCMIFLREKIETSKIICVLLCVGGILMFYNGGGDGEISITGIFLALASSITYAFYSIYLEHSSAREVPSFVLIFYLNCIGSVMLLILAVCMGDFSLEIAPKGWVASAVLAVLNTFVGVYGFQLGVKYIGAQNSTLISTVEPVTSILVGVVCYSESLTFRTLIGTVLILASAVIVAGFSGNKEEKKTEICENRCKESRK